MNLTRYKMTSSVLKRHAQFLWHFTSAEPISKGKLLPVTNSDLIICVKSPMRYHYADEEPSQAPPVHIRNIKQRPQFVEQEAGCDIWGISLLPYGIYPFVGDMNYHRECLIDLTSGQPEICSALIEGLRSLRELSECVSLIENQIETLVKFFIADSDKAMMDDYLAHMSCGSIGEYCKTAGVSIK